MLACVIFHTRTHYPRCAHGAAAAAAAAAAAGGDKAATGVGTAQVMGDAKAHGFFPDPSTALAYKAEAQKIFAEFTEAQRRDYVEWVTSAKREATRASRIATAVEWISEGKRRNWKYENC